MSVDAVLFDLDGTLVGSIRLYIECYRRALAPYLGGEPTDEELFALRPRAELRFLPEQVGETHAQTCLDAFYRHYEALHDEWFEGVYPGVPELLTELRAREIPLGIVTGKSRRAWEITRPHADLGAFDAVIFDDDVSDPKPHPHGLEIALEALGARPERSVYIGDTASDLRAARAAGVPACAALWSKQGDWRRRLIERAEQEGATPLDAPSDLIRWIDRRTPPSGPDAPQAPSTGTSRQ